MSAPPGPERKPLRILTNIERFPEHWTAAGGRAVVVHRAKRLGEFVRGLRSCDLALVDGDMRVILGLCALFSALPFLRKTLIVVDPALGMAPAGWCSRLKAALKKALFRQVDHFINYFKESPPYSRFFGIGPARSTFVPFKPNLRGRCETGFQPEGEYVLCCGRSRRDYDAFFRAIARLPHPAAVPRPDLSLLRAHSSRFTWPLDRLPANVKLLEDDGSHEAMARMIRGARLVVLPLLPGNMLGGNGLSLSAMILGKCVIVTEGAGVSDIMTDQALFVRPDDDDMLARTIQRAWEDDRLRLRTAESGYRWAYSLGGETELHQRILDATVRWLESGAG